MYKPSPKIVNLIEIKIKRVRKLQRTSLILDTFINFLIMSINITSIILAIIILNIEYGNLLPEKKTTFFVAMQNIENSAFFAALIILLFILSFIFTIYKAKAKYRKYRQTFKDFEYLVVKFKNVKEYTLEEFQRDLDEVETRNLKQTKTNIKQSIREILLKKVN